MNSFVTAVFLSSLAVAFGQGLSQYGSGGSQPSNQYSNGGGSGSGSGSFGGGSHQGMPYAYTYEVNAPEYGNDYGHQEQSDGQIVRGSYRVALPDGRIQTVSYTADHENGYQATVEYQGEASFPDQPSRPSGGNQGSYSPARPSSSLPRYSSRK